MSKQPLITRRTPDRLNWNLFNRWHLSNEKIAQLAGCNVPTVRAARWRHSTIKPPHPSPWNKIDWSKTNKEISRLTGKSYGAVFQARRRWAP